MQNKPKGYLPKAEFDSIYSRVPRPCVELIVRTPKGVVLTKRSIDPGKGKWHFPGGTILFGEHVTETINRTARTELGVEVKVEKLLGYVEYPQMYIEGYNGWPIGIAFEVSVVGGEITKSSEADDLGYFTEVPEGTLVDHATFLNKHVF